MPKITKTIGTGMTERGIVHFDWDEPGDVDAQVEAAIETFNRSSFARLSSRLAKLATGILSEADLPSDPEKAYLVTTQGAWAVVEEDMELGSEMDDAHLPLDVAVEHCGFAPDSPEGYAATVLMTLRTADRQLQAQCYDDAMAAAFAAGGLVNEAGMKGMFDQDFLVGEKVRAGGRKGHKQTYGTEEKKAAERQAYLQAYDSELAKGARKTKACETVAKRFGVHPITIRRAVGRRDSQR